MQSSLPSGFVGPHLVTPQDRKNRLERERPCRRDFMV